MLLAERIESGADLAPAVRRLLPDVVVDGCRESGGIETEYSVLRRALPDASMLVMMCAEAPRVRPELTRLAPKVGFVSTDESCDRFTEAIRRLADGGAVIGPDVALSTLKAKDNPLTVREREVLGLVLTGASTREIADRLCLRVGTVRNYLSNSIAKVGARTRVDAVRIAQDEGWI
ncbi:response regulator transcription factor [Glycomyces salinus]|uniref:response regulator transcription factor n=1 Tax=Glycomyces salinus TaxID=980294 RepID=UPI0018EA487F|nr:response regulator transcription factor [Glycomyces salinus]